MNSVSSGQTARALFRSTQKAAERQNSYIRKTLLRVDESLAFGKKRARSDSFLKNLDSRSYPG